MVMRSVVIVVSCVSERNNDYGASDRSEVGKRFEKNANLTKQDHQI